MTTSRGLHVRKMLLQQIDLLGIFLLRTRVKTTVNFSTDALRGVFLVENQRVVLLRRWVFVRDHLKHDVPQDDLLVLNHTTCATRRRQSTNCGLLMANSLAHHLAQDAITDVVLSGHRGGCPFGKNGHQQFAEC